MINSIHLESYERLLDDLKLMAQETNRFLSTDTDVFISKNINFFTKSFMIMMCAYLEFYIKDISMVIIDEMNIRLEKNQIPYNLIKWYLSKNKKLEGSELKFEHLVIKILKDELDISGNPFRTEALFKNFGIKLQGNIEFETRKDRIQTLVSKRNNIIHHNDNASDLSVTDIIENILYIKSYILAIDNIVVKHISIP